MNIEIKKILEIIKDVRSHYPTKTFTPPPPPESINLEDFPVAPDRYSAAGCRLACELIRNKIIEEIERELLELIQETNSGLDIYKVTNFGRDVCKDED